MPLDKIQPIGKIRYQQSQLRDGRNTDAVIFIPEELLQRKKVNGLTLYLNVFWLSKDLLNFRRFMQHKVAVFSVSQHVRIGDKDYNAPYVKLEIIVPQEELPKITGLLMKGTCRTNLQVRNGSGLPISSHITGSSTRLPLSHSDVKERKE